MDNSIETVEKATTQYIVVKIGNEQYGLNISNIDNIVRMQKITRVPKAQSYFKGIINLRGEIVPVMSIRMKMGLDADQFTDASRIIILKIEEQGAVGIIVDQVREVVELSADDIEPKSSSRKGEKESFISGIGKHGNELISLFEINSIVSEQDNV